MSTILITGGTGLVGTNLGNKLKQKDYEVAVLSSRISQNAGILTYKWDLDKKQIQPEAIEKADYIIHLAGANIGEKRWTEKRKQLIIDSRIKTAELLWNKIREINKKPLAFISASAIGIYGSKTSGKIFIETDSPANDFLANTCSQWEQTADRFRDLGIRTVKIRTGIVLAKEGGALKKMLTPVRMGIGSALGKGNQYMPWIHIDDLCGIYIKAIEDARMLGAYNAVAPAHITNREFTKMLAHVLKKPFWFPNVPAFVMKMIFGEMSRILLEGSRVSSQKIITAGYSFLFPDLESALKDLLGSV